MSPLCSLETAPERPALRSASTRYSKIKVIAAMVAQTFPTPLCMAKIIAVSVGRETTSKGVSCTFSPPCRNAYSANGKNSISSAKRNPIRFFIQAPPFLERFYYT